MWVVVSCSEELYHHGILGQRWGRRNGPPYPLGAGDHSPSEKKAGWRKSLDNGNGKADNGSRNRKADQSNKVKIIRQTGKTYHRGLTPEQKKALAIGATAAGLALATYGAYKLGYLDKLQDLGKSYAGDLLKKIGDVPVSEIPKVNANPASASSIKIDPKTGFRMIHESLGDSLRNSNPLKGTPQGRNNCTYSAVAGYLRTLGYDVTAKGTGGKMQNLGGVLEECFSGVKVHEGSAIRFGKSPEAAAEILRSKFGDNAAGAVQVQFKYGRGGHAFSWQIVNGVVDFLDFQQGTSGSSVKNLYWNFIDPNGSLQFARLDGLEINAETIHKFVDGR